MTVRRTLLALLIASGLSYWGYALSNETPERGLAPIPREQAIGEGNHDEAEARYRNSQRNHWRHAAIGNCCLNR